MTRGLTGTLLKVMGGKDFTLTVTDRTDLAEHRVRLGFDGGGLLTAHPTHPTMWVRLWFPRGAKLRQRAYTLIDPDPASDRFDVEFALHDGPAPNWARSARPGDTIAATVHGSRYLPADPAPDGYLVIGDIASLPAINSLLTATIGVPAKVWLEWQHEDDQKAEVNPAALAEVTWVRREREGADLVDAVRAAAFDAAGHRAWVACDTSTTRAVVSVLREDYGLARTDITAQGYWLAR
jgi:NADPH-dependent ferric siderophore reductase